MSLLVSGNCFGHQPRVLDLDTPKSRLEVERPCSHDNHTPAHPVGVSLADSAHRKNSPLPPPTHQPGSDSCLPLSSKSIERHSTKARCFHSVIRFHEQRAQKGKKILYSLETSCWDIFQNRVQWIFVEAVFRLDYPLLRF